MLLVMLIVAASLPLAWLLSEMQRHRWVSVLLGFASLVAVGFLTYGYAEFVTTINLNSSYGDATKSLLTAVSDELQAGNDTRVKREFKRFAAMYHPNYENSPRYEDEVSKFISRLKTSE
jgi:hypothetical protein